MKYSLGLQPPRPESVKLKLADYLNHNSVLPNIPDPNNFGHTNLISRWGMLGNGPDGNVADVPVGNCAEVGPEHIIMGWAAGAGKPVPPFTYQSTIVMYKAITGYDPSQTQPDGSNPTDQGSDMTAVAQYWQTTGFTDSAGGVHKISAFLALNPRDINQIAAATYLFEAVGFGFDLPASAEQQFEAEQPWSVVPDAQIVGGHFVPVIGRRGGNFQGITWGGVVAIEPEFIQEYATMAIVYLSPEMLNAQGKSAEGFNFAQLAADLPELETV